MLTLRPLFGASSGPAALFIEMGRGILVALRRSYLKCGSFLIAGLAGLAAHGNSASNGDRTISFYHIHTQETLTITYKKGGKYDSEAMKKIDWIMRDWRKNQAIKIDPETIDLAWEMYQELGSNQPISIICGYRSPSTNEMLRKTRGGQASQSQHMTGKAIDITFPDVTLKRIRYSALVRERGGVGYYPTSGIPFVHIDTARVRAWPRLPRQELALLFPEGHTQHAPAEGGPITPADVRDARAKNRELSIQIAQFHDDRRNGRSSATQVASASPSQPLAAADRKPFALASLGGTGGSTITSGKPTGQISLTWEKPAKPGAPATGEQRKVVAAFAPPTITRPKPQLVTAPKLVDRSSRFTTAQSDKDRARLTDLVQQASLEAPAKKLSSAPSAASSPKLVVGPKPAVRPQKALAEAAIAAASPASTPALTGNERKVAALAPDRNASSITDMSPDSLGNGWVQAPEFDEDHPEELAYRPFPLAPLLTDTPSAHDPQLAGLQHPDVGATLEMIDDEGAIAPMKFRPGQQIAQVLWAQQFQGKAVNLDALQEIDANRLASGIDNRAVRTSNR